MFESCETVHHCSLWQSEPIVHWWIIEMFNHQTERKRNGWIMKHTHSHIRWQTSAQQFGNGRWCWWLLLIADNSRLLPIIDLSLAIHCQIIATGNVVNAPTSLPQTQHFIYNTLRHYRNDAAKVIESFPLWSTRLLPLDHLKILWFMNVVTRALAFSHPLVGKDSIVFLCANQ